VTPVRREKGPQRVLVVGLGVIGTGYGWVLSRAGHDVVHLLRPGRAAQVGRRILIDALDTRSGKLGVHLSAYKPAFTEEVAPDDRFDLVIVPVKHWAVADVLRELEGKLPGARYLLFGSDWDGLSEVEALVPRSRCMWGFPASTGGHSAELLVFNLSGTYRTGPVDGEEPEWAAEVAQLFAGASIAPAPAGDMRAWLWADFARSAGTAGSMLYAGGLREFYEDEAGLRERMVPAVRECLAVLAARGVDPVTVPDVAPFVTRPAGDIAAATHRAIGSPWVQRMVASGPFPERDEELVRTYLDVLATGEELGVSMPVMESFRDSILRGRR
jgi:2-dehydropantoate 2-reductase